ncbi:sodium-dependent phosphate transporter 2 isoform X2 [Cryptotermes secundus]|nr:sodium-dependent phosphate transporter 2 isoform X2 [Cryptotermes secundus]
MLGMFAVLIASSVMLLGATFLKLPVSATHSIVGATVGFSLVCRGNRGLNWRVLGMVVGSWFLSPVLSGVISLLMFMLIRCFILNTSNPIARGLLCLPISYGITIFINVFSVVHGGPSLLYFDRIPWWGTLLISVFTGAVAMLIVQFFLVPFMRRKIRCRSDPPSGGTVLDDLRNTNTFCTEANDMGKETLTQPNGQTEQLTGSSGGSHSRNGSTKSNQEAIHPGDVTSLGHDNPVFSLSSDNSTEQPPSECRDDPKNNQQPKQEAPPELFSFLQILAATFASFARGGNDVSNAIGPVIAIWLIYTEGSVHQNSETPLYLLFYGGVGMSVGLCVWGQRVMKTIGEDLTEIAASTGFTIEIGAAFTVLLASKIGLPISTTHCKVGSIVFVGWASSTKQGVDWKLFRNIVAAWLVTVPISGLLSAAAVAILKETAL